MAHAVVRCATMRHVWLQWGAVTCAAVREAVTWPYSFKMHSNGAHKAGGGQQCSCKGVRGAEI